MKTHFQAYRTGLKKKWVGIMDGDINLSVKVSVQEENSTLILKGNKPPGLFFVGGK